MTIGETALPILVAGLLAYWALGISKSWWEAHVPSGPKRPGIERAGLIVGFLGSALLLIAWSPSALAAGSIDLDSIECRLRDGLATCRTHRVAGGWRVVQGSTNSLTAAVRVAEVNIYSKMYGVQHTSSAYHCAIVGSDPGSRDGITTAVRARTTTAPLRGVAIALKPGEWLIREYKARPSWRRASHVAKQCD